MRKFSPIDTRATVPLDAFDAVVMLTWSNWHTEPRSNRYHYASRFAAHLPVIFLQPTLPEGDSLKVEPSELAGVEIVNVSHELDDDLAQEVCKYLDVRGIKRPLLWIYSSTHYPRLLARLPYALRVYHATEDYLTPSAQWGPSQEAIKESVRQVLTQVDLLVAVSRRVLKAYIDIGGYRGQAIVAENGCDTGFFEAAKPPPRALDEKVALFQGGINDRLDYGLLVDLVRRMEDWTFWFCGREATTNPQWGKLKAMSNVRYLGALAPGDVASRMWSATVGIIPFVEDPMIWNSLPLKAYEFVACGLPVVSVPIESLSARPDLFEIASGSEAFAAGVRRVAATRDDPTARAARRTAAHSASYDRRFESVLDALGRMLRYATSLTRRLNVVVLYDDASMFVNTIREHLESFARYSRHQVFYLPATDLEPDMGFGFEHIDGVNKFRRTCDLTMFDVLVLHYSVRVSVHEHMNEAVAKACAEFPGLKVLYLQDEYESPEIARQWIERLRFDLVYTCVPLDEVEKVYPQARFPDVEFLPTLTGYVPEDPLIDSYAIPLEDRKSMIGYRGRKLPPIYGDLGYEKYFIGVRMKELARERGLEADIEVDDSKRIYGQDWYRFMASSRATLGTESGCNIFDFDGILKAQLKELTDANPLVEYPELRERLLGRHEGQVRMNQISPKVFEAIRTRTALILFEGSYSGVVKSGVHFIALKKDFSNVDEVFASLADDRFLKDMTDRAYTDIIESGRYSYAAFIGSFDIDVDRRFLRGPAFAVHAVPVLGVATGGETISMAAEDGRAYLLSTAVVDRRSSRKLVIGRMQFGGALLDRQQSEAILESIKASQMAARRYSVVRQAWHMVPLAIRRPMAQWARAFAGRYGRHPSERSIVDRMAASAWKALPDKLRNRLRRVLRG